LQSSQLYFRLPCGQELQSAQLYFSLPCGHGLQSPQRYFSACRADTFFPSPSLAVERLEARAYAKSGAVASLDQTASFVFSTAECSPENPPSNPEP
jgi:hypothetical protein